MMNPCRSLSVVRGTTLAGNVAVRLRACVDAVREHAGDAFVDVERAREQSRRAVSGVAGTTSGARAPRRPPAEAFEDMFDEEGNRDEGTCPSADTRSRGWAG